jgi:hypothetical protein
MDELLTVSSLVEQMEIPDEFVAILTDSIALLPGESLPIYLEFISLMTIDVSPQNNIEWLTVFELAALLWDQKRYRGWKRAIILQNHASAVEQALLKSDPDYQLVGPKSLVRAQARQDAQEWKQSEAAREKFRPRMEAIGYNSDGLHAEAFSQSAMTLAAIEQLLASIRRQISRLLADVFVRREFRNRARRFAAQLVLLETSAGSNNKGNSDGV